MTRSQTLPRLSERDLQALASRRLAVRAGSMPIAILDDAIGRAIVSVRFNDRATYDSISRRGSKGTRWSIFVDLVFELAVQRGVER